MLWVKGLIRSIESLSSDLAMYARVSHAEKITFSIFSSLHYRLTGNCHLRQWREHRVLKDWATRQEAVNKAVMKR